MQTLDEVVGLDFPWVIAKGDAAVPLPQMASKLLGDHRTPKHITVKNYGHLNKIEIQRLARQLFCPVRKFDLPPALVEGCQNWITSVIEFDQTAVKPTGAHKLRFRWNDKPLTDAPTFESYTHRDQGPGDNPVRENAVPKDRFYVTRTAHCTAGIKDSVSYSLLRSIDPTLQSGVMRILADDPVYKEYMFRTDELLKHVPRVIPEANDTVLFGATGFHHQQRVRLGEVIASRLWRLSIRPCGITPN